MGDRANIIVKMYDNEQVCLYTHWGGTELPEVLRQALIRGKGRWADPSYLARIIFSEMLLDGCPEGDERRVLKEETGFGISQTLGDDEYGPIVVDTTRQTIHCERATICRDDYFSFSAYTELEQATWTQEEGT